MQDWLRTFGVYDPAAASVTGFDWYIPTAHKSLIVGSWCLYERHFD